MAKEKGVIWKEKADLDSGKDVAHILALASVTLSVKEIVYGRKKFTCRFLFLKFVLNWRKYVYFHLLNLLLDANLEYSRNIF